jgi:hypothetical protein
MSHTFSHFRVHTCLPTQLVEAEDGESSEQLDVVCSVCEEAWAAERLEEHSELCAVLRQVGGCRKVTESNQK